ncbi:hypothetical protein [Paramicrobacterium humi]|uniref:hypothetical protein n=1 Tax=Paramicrobacterium humi TaxID=640635 RepID=UPI000B814617|nr:hypothetical protein [Microbacterium humi]
MLAAAAAIALALPFASASGAQAAEPAPAAGSQSAVAAPNDDAAPKDTTTPGQSVSPTPPPTTTPPAPTLTITSPPPEALVKQSSVTVTGAGATPGAKVHVQRDQNGSEPCVTTASADGTFSCRITVYSGDDVTVEAQELGADTGASVTFDVLTPATLTHTGTLLTNGRIAGSAFPGATVTVTAASGTLCTATAEDSGAWFCTITGRDGAHSATVTQSTSWGSVTGSPVSLVLDTVAPARPVITGPSEGTRLPLSGATFSGSADTGSKVIVFAGSQTLCTAVAKNGSWSCSAGALAKPGNHTIVAGAWDAAGNASGDSVALRYPFGSASLAPTTPGTTQPSQTEHGTVSPDTPGPEETTPGHTKDEQSSAPPSIAAPPAGPGAPGPWEHATPFSHALPAALGADALAGWLRALALALLTVLLILVPARLLAGTLTTRRSRTAKPALTGRNRSAREFETSLNLGVPGRLAMTAVGVVAAGALTIFANPVDGQPAYLRLLLASCIAVGIVNVVGAWVPRILVHAWQCGFAEVRFNPRWLLVVGAAVVVSRAFDLHPALLFALVTTVRVPSVLSDALRARLALCRMGGVFAVGVLAWLIASLVPRGGGFVTQLLVETANITALVGIGSAAIMMVPLGRLSGRAVFARSRLVWTASVLAILTALFVMLGPSIADWRATGNVLAALALTLGFAAIGFSVWLWKRYVQPRLTV